MKITIIVFFLTVTVRSIIPQDPCVSYSILPRSEYRGSQCNYVQNKAVCDVFLLTNTWFRAEGLNGPLIIQNSPAEFQQCGTKFPWWMNGTHPDEADGEVEREACLTDLSSNCSLSQTINVKNCGAFYVYKLPQTGSCPQAYCFGENDPCPPFDPCDVYEYTAVPYDEKRSLHCFSDDITTCDIFDSTAWFTFRRDTLSLNLSTSCPVSTCGTQTPHWLTDAVIETSNGTHIGIVCIKDGDNCCRRSTTIEYKNCADGFTVYRFNQDYAGECQTYCTDDPHVYCTTQSEQTKEMSTSTETYGEKMSCPNDDDECFPRWTIGAIVAAIAVGALMGGLLTFAIMSYRLRRVSDTYQVPCDPCGPTKWSIEKVSTKT